jgi:hypothetical protein
MGELDVARAFRAPAPQRPRSRGREDDFAVVLVELGGIFQRLLVAARLDIVEDARTISRFLEASLARSGWLS